MQTTILTDHKQWCSTNLFNHKNKYISGADSGGGAPGARPPLKLEKIWFFFGVKSWFFTRNTPKIFAPPSARRNFFNCDPLKLKSWIRPCISGSPGAVVIHNLSNFNNDHSSEWHQTTVIDNCSNHNTSHFSDCSKTVVIYNPSNCKINHSSCWPQTVVIYKSLQSLVDPKKWWSIIYQTTIPTTLLADNKIVIDNLFF